MECNPLATRAALRAALRDIISEKPTIAIHIHSSHCFAVRYADSTRQ